MKHTPATLLLEIGCEEIPARMIANASAELERRLLEILDTDGVRFELPERSKRAAAVRRALAEL